MIVELQDAGVRGIGRIEGAFFVDAEAERAGKVSLGSGPPGLEKCSVGEKDVDASLLRVCDINRATRIDRDPCRVTHPRIFEGLQGNPTRFKLVDEAGGRVWEENVAQ